MVQKQIEKAWRLHYAGFSIIAIDLLTMTINRIGWRYHSQIDKVRAVQAEIRKAANG